MLRDRGLLVPRGQTWELAEGAEIPFPEGIHGIISARLDTLTPDRKGLLQDASVIGKVFWSLQRHLPIEGAPPAAARGLVMRVEQVLCSCCETVIGLVLLDVATCAGCGDELDEAAALEEIAVRAAAG